MPGRSRPAILKGLYSDLVIRRRGYGSAKKMQQRSTVASAVSEQVDAWRADKYSVAKRATGAGLKSIDGAGERILDVGCGSGELTLKLLERGCDVVGIDSSPSMVASARAKGVDAQVLDAHDLALGEEFDAVFSNAALHWMVDDPRGVVQRVRRALKPGGKFVLEMGAEGNIQSAVNAIAKVFAARQKKMPNYWYFPSKGEYIQLLESEGFEVKEAIIFRRPTSIPAGIVGWLEVFVQKYTVHFEDAEREQVREEIVKAMEPIPVDKDGNAVVDYVRLRIHAVKRI